MKDKYQSLLEDLKKALDKRDHLTEATSAFDILDTVEFAQAKEEWEGFEDTYEGQLALIEAAKDRESNAVKYIFSLLLPIITKVFWDKYLGKSSVHRARRMAQGDDKEFLGEVFMLLLDDESPLDSFDPTKYSRETNLIQKLGYYIMRYLEHLTRKLNRATTRKGLTGKLKKDEHDNLQMGSYEAHYENNDDIATEQDFLEGVAFDQWTDFVLDPTLDEQKSPTYREVLTAVLDQESFNVTQLAKSLMPERGQAAATSLLRQRLSGLKSVFDQYGISQDTFAGLLKNYGAKTLLEEL